MTTHPPQILRVGFGVVCFLLLHLAAQAAEFHAGFATLEITPPAGWRRAGNYTELVSTGVHDPLLAKATVLSRGETIVAFVGNDLDFYIPTRRAFENPDRAIVRKPTEHVQDDAQSSLTK